MGIFGRRCRVRRISRAAILFLIVPFVVPSQALALTDKGFRALHNFTKVLHYIEDNYVAEIDEEKLIQGAIRGMVGTLDPHSVYMSPEVYRELKVDTRGRFDGVGIEVSVRKGRLTVVAPIKGSPADKAGIQAGDQIIKINGDSTKDMDLGEAVTKMRGRRGSRVTLTMSRDGVKEPFDLTIVRQIITVPSVRKEELGDGIGYVAISSFQQGTAKALEKSLEELSSASSLRGLIIDLRKNPGGLLDQAVLISDLFLTKGVIVTTENRGEEIDRREAHPEETEPDYPIIVLIDGGSASASEILAGALQDQGRAKVMGTKSFGKGSVQTVIDMDDGSGLKLTIAHYHTPSGRVIQDQGIEPDIVVEATPPKIAEAPSDGEPQEASVSAEQVKQEKEEKEPKLQEETPSVDIQKQQALEEMHKMIRKREGRTTVAP